MTLFEAALPYFKAKAKREARTRRWRKRLCWLLGHKPDLKCTSMPIYFSKPSEGADRRTRSEWGCLWCRCDLPTTYSED